MGVDGILCKPIVPALMYRRILDVLPESRSERVFGTQPAKDVRVRFPKLPISLEQPALSPVEGRDTDEEDAFLI